MMPSAGGASAALDPLLELPGHLRRRLAESLSAGTLGPPYSVAAVRSSLGAAPEEASTVAASLAALDRSGIPGRGVALALRAADRAREAVTRPDLVWSGPEVPGLHARDTRRVYEELIGGAERSIWASTYAYFDGPKAFKVMADRMDARPELSVRLLLNIARKWGDTTTSENLVKRTSSGRRTGRAGAGRTPTTTRPRWTRTERRASCTRRAWWSTTRPSS